MRGQFVIYPDTPRQIIVPNNVLDEGEETFLKMIARASVAEVAAGGDFFVGICGAAFAEDTTLATLVGEPTAAGGYARKAVTRDAVGWPTISEVNGVWRAQTATFTWLPAGAAYDADISRLFLCNVAAGAGGLLFSVSGALPTAITLADGVAFPARYELYLR